MYKFIKIRHDIIKQCHGNYKEMKKFNYKLEIEIFRNSTQKDVGVLRGSFQGFGCPKRHPDALLAKTMINSNSTRTDRFYLLPGLCHSSIGHRHYKGPSLPGVVSCSSNFYGSQFYPCDTAFVCSTEDLRHS